MAGWTDWSIRTHAGLLQMVWLVGWLVGVWSVLCCFESIFLSLSLLLVRMQLGRCVVVVVVVDR